MATPSFGLAATCPRQPDTNASSEPEIKLVFNAESAPRKRSTSCISATAAGSAFAADVRQGTVEEEGYELGGPGALRTWAEEFVRATNTNLSAVDDAANWQPNKPGRQPADRDTPHATAAG